MTTSELAQQIKSAGFFPIHVKWNPARDEDSELQFSGSLEGFFEATKALEIKSIFFFAWKLDEEDFLYDSDCEDDSDPSDEEPAFEKSDVNNESFDLTVALPSLKDFKKRIGQEYQFHLLAKNQFVSVSFSLSENWWNSFEEQREKATQNVKENRDAIRSKMGNERLKNEENLFRQVRELLNDPDFCAIPTQVGMRAYAMEKFPELEKANFIHLTTEIRKLNLKVKARKRK